MKKILHGANVIYFFQMLIANIAKVYQLVHVNAVTQAEPNTRPKQGDKQPTE